eukprot:1586235-Pyramimonas_sp.AAC.1
MRRMRTSSTPVMFPGARQPKAALRDGFAAAYARWADAAEQIAQRTGSKLLKSGLRGRAPQPILRP